MQERAARKQTRTSSQSQCGTGDLKIALSATNGVLTLSGTTGLTFTAGDGTADSAITATGKLSDINAALDVL